MAVRRLCVLSAVLVVVPTPSSAEDVVVQDFLTCSDIIQESVRLACYDKVSDTFRQEPVAEVAPVEVQKEVPREAADIPEFAAASKVEARVVPLTDDVGLSALERDAAEEPQIIRATVTECRRDPRGKYNFYFDNGQVWKQSDASRHKYEDCDFSVTITKDSFGFRMLPDGETRRIRISRIK